jgi:plasmid stabilization system protein ParE
MLVDKIRSSPLSFPNRGRIGLASGRRELPLAPLPYVVVYRVRRDVAGISRIWHGAQSRTQ